MVTDQQGEVIFDSGYVNGEALDWPLQNLKGEAVASGLYAYTLTTKAATDETARTQRGHLIIDRAGSSADRVWVTSNPELSVGAASEARKVTVVGGGETTVGGAELPRERPSSSQSDPRTAAGREDTTRTSSMKGETTTATSATGDRIAKFASDGVTLIDSTITETPAGDIGIGTTAPGGAFDLQRASSSDILQRIFNTGVGAGAGSKLRFVAATGATSQVQLTDSAEFMMSIAGNNATGMQFRIRNVNDMNSEAGLAAAARMTILRNGNVGIGTTSPLRALQLGPSSDALFTLEPTDISPNAGYIRFGDRTGWKLHIGRSRRAASSQARRRTLGRRAC
ncbi:MAG TPA: hypothetical protein VFD58_14465 [Blastocatellia bacterium]|nr:hypothetical protein [Blastocatellia bacterium]